MEIAETRFVRNPRPFETEYTFDEILSELCMPIDAHTRGEFDRNLGARSRQVLVRGFELLK